MPPGSAKAEVMESRMGPKSIIIMDLTTDSASVRLVARKKTHATVTNRNVIIHCSAGCRLSYCLRKSRYRTLAAPCIRPHKRKSQPAPCHRPLARNTTIRFTQVRTRPLRLPPSGK